MGVTGLWRLVEPAGKPVPIETLENKVLAVDISIWLHQMVKGYQDAKGAPMANAHLLGLFQRLCKLLYYRIKPIFVFDGAFPELKKETIAKRHDSKAKLNSESERLKREILLLLGKKTAVGSLLGKQTSPSKAARSEPADSEDLFKLPALDESQEFVSSDSESEEEDPSAPVIDLHSIDITSENFKSLPLREKHDLLIELKETRKMNSWGKLHELPKDSDNFSNYQMNRLLKRRKVQECLEETEKEIGGDTMTLNELESLLNEEGINTNMDSLPTKRIASNSTTRYLLISNVKKALEDAKKQEEEKSKGSNKIEKDHSKSEVRQEQPSTSKTDDSEDDLQKAIQMSLECADEEDKQENSKQEESSDSTFMLDSDYSDSSEEEYEAALEFNSAKAYIMQNSDFTANAIKDIITSTKPQKVKPKNRTDEIIKELDQEVPFLPNYLPDYEKKSCLSNVKRNHETVELSSSEDECIEVDSECDKILQKNFVIVNTTLEDSDVSVSENYFNMNNEEVNKNFMVSTKCDENVEKLHTLCDEKECEIPKFTKHETDSDEDFEEVPENDTVPLIAHPVVEVNLEMKDTLEDDIFADVFKIQDGKTEEITEFNESETEIEKYSKMESETVLSESTVKGDGNKSSKSVPSKISGERLQKDLDKDSACIISVSEKLFHSSKPENVATNEKNNEMAKINHSDTMKDISTVETKTKTSGNNPKEYTNSEELTTEKLNSMAEQLETEHEDLLQEKSRLDRMGRNITEQMTRDAQELLQIFGIPFVVAPTEAEAQCAFLETAKLTDGTITDDSDIWLFGGRTVYKNFFNQKKHVVQFLSERIEKSFNLTREQLILLALLVGSDYTTGVSGVGPVTAMEILAAFSGSRRELLLSRATPPSPAKYAALLAGLQEFKRWVRTGKRTDDTSLRKKLKNVAVSDDFPSLRVVQAYMEPKIETSKEKFTWGEPDVTILRDFTRKKFGWSQNKLDEILNPVLKRIQENRSQKSMQDYFKRKIEFHSLEDQMSKRVKAAVEKMGPKTNAEAPKTDMDPPKKIPRKRKTRVKTKDPEGANSIEIHEYGADILGNPDYPSTSNSIPNIVKVCGANETLSSGIDIVVPKLARYQEIIPQREKDRMNVLQNKLKAIEVFRKTQLDRKGTRKRKINLPKEKADLSESDSD